MDKQSILAADDLKSEAVEVAEWGGTVYVRTLTGAERDDFMLTCARARAQGKKLGLEADPRGITCRLLVATLCDETGKALFTPDDADALATKNSRILDELFEVAQRVNALQETDVDDLVKNSESDRSGASGSASR